jgi:hypothetical protein
MSGVNPVGVITKHKCPDCDSFLYKSSKNIWCSSFYCGWTNNEKWKKIMKDVNEKMKSNYYINKYRFKIPRENSASLKKR